MKYCFIVIFAIFCSTLFSQKTSWVSYFPVQDSIIGRLFIGVPSDCAFLKDSEWSITSYEARPSFSTFDRNQRKALTLKFNQLFQSDNVQVKDIYAKNLYIDCVKENDLLDVDINKRFVYSGMRADSVSITFTTVKNSIINTNGIVNKLKILFPTLSNNQIGDLLLAEMKDSSNSEFKATIGTPSIYFLIQIAEVKKGRTKSSIFKINENGASGKYMGFYLSYDVDDITSGTKIPGLNQTFYLFTGDGELYLKLAKPNSIDSKDVHIPFVSCKSTLPIFIHKFPETKGRNVISINYLTLKIYAVKNEKNSMYEITSWVNEYGNLKKVTKVELQENRLEIINW